MSVKDGRYYGRPIVMKSLIQNVWHAFLRKEYGMAQRNINTIQFKRQLKQVLMV